VAESNCVVCGHVRQASEQLGIYCAGCGKPRLPFARIFVWSTALLITIFFYSEFVSQRFRLTMLVISLVSLTLVYCVLVLRHRPRAASRAVWVLLPVAVLSLEPMLWALGDSLPEVYSFVVTVLVIASWTALVLQVFIALFHGIDNARKDPELSSESLVLTIFALFGILISGLHFLLPLATEAGRDLQYSAFRTDLLDVLEGAQTILSFVVNLRAELTAFAAVVVLFVTVVNAFRSHYRYAGRFSVNTTDARLALRIAKGLISLIWTTLKFWIVIGKSLFPLVLLIGAALLLYLSVLQVGTLTSALWSNGVFMGLSPANWLKFAISLVASGIGLIAVGLIASGVRLESFSQFLADVRGDSWGLLQALGFISSKLAYSFFLFWIIVMIYRMATGAGGEHAILFYAFITYWVALAAIAYFKKLDRDSLGSDASAF
jgi:hypothetical protein